MINRFFSTVLWVVWLTVCFLLGLVSGARADVLGNCITLVDEADVTATANGTVTVIESTQAALRLTPKAFTAILEATNDSGTTPTLDVKIQTCETTSTSTCHDIPDWTFTQCTTGACSGGDAWEAIDLIDSNLFPYFRAVMTLSGTNPNYDVLIRVCYR